MKRFLLPLLLLATLLSAQTEPTLDYYLPDIPYDPTVPTPQSVFGFVPGEWHLSHDQVVQYMTAVAAASNRVTVETYARTYEERPLLLLTITHPDNHARLEDIRTAHLAKLENNTRPGANDPVVVYQGFSVHGNEASGGNAAPLLLYYLAAGQDAEVERLLRRAVVLLDPVYNPDGFHRFSTWVNMHKSIHAPVSDPASREYTEVYPRGRTNHYWFDLNRDWLPVQHPSSRGRIRNFHKWMPNVLTDHHEMGSNRSFFFQPGIPSRTNPLTPPLNQELTGRIGEFHAGALDKIGSFYYTQESFDDYYYGKGSTYPDINGSVGILFEQASSRGHVQDTENGLLTFPFTIRNQLTTALSTLTAAVELRPELLRYQQQFFADARNETKNNAAKGYVFTVRDGDSGRMRAFLDIVRTHDIEVYLNETDLTADGRSFRANRSFLLPFDQRQGRLLRAMFQTQTEFQDSLFYDVSAWNFGHAFHLDYAEVTRLPKLGDPADVARSFAFDNPLNEAAYAWLIPWSDYYAPRVLHQLQQLGVRTKVATEPFAVPDYGAFAAGTILVPRQGQFSDALLDVLGEAASAMPVVGLDGGTSTAGPFLGSPKFVALEQPRVLLLAGPGVTSYDAGEVWHLMDQRYHVPITMVEPDRLGRVDLAKYNVMVMPNGSYGDLSKGDIDGLKDWLGAGNTLIAMRGAVRWAKNNGLANVTFKSDPARPETGNERRPYTQRSADRGADVIGGAIFEATLDLTHPLAYGYAEETLPVFRNTRLFLEVAENDYATPLVYTDAPLLAGYISDRNLETLSGSAAVVVAGRGRGRVICMPDNPNFRAFWWGTNKLFANAVFFGQVISSGATER